ncbi:MAG TPA: hypothetical protein VKA46_06505 [Gemmataceae bacterium]|nr:hypothetical protein [Gemmataceae bacterium]
MQADVWKALLRRIPSEQIDNLMLMTTQGTEINIQTVLLMDEDFMLLRGRIAGSNDGGRIFILPYEHLDHAGFQRPLNDAQLQAVFGIAPAEAAPPPAPPAPAEPLPAAPAQPQSLAPAAVAPPAQGTAAAGLLARVPTRSKIIQRLRLRTEAREGADSPPKE